MAGKFVLTAQMQLQAPTNTQQVRRQIQQQLSNINIKPVINTQALSNANKQLQNTANAAGKANSNLRAASKSANSLGSALGSAARRFASITIATGFFLGLTRAIGDSVRAALEFEKELIKISQVTGRTTKQLSDITREVTKLSGTLGVSSQQLLTVSRTLLQAGFSADTTRKALSILAKTDLAATFDNLQDTTEGAIALLRQFSSEAAKAGGTTKFLEKSIDAINAVSKNFAVESKDLISVIRRTGGVFEAAGGNLNELIALFTSVRATTRETAETIATGFRTIFTRVQRTETIDQLRELGIVLQDSTGKFVGPLEAVKRLSIGLSSLDPRDFRFNQIVEQLGGFRQVGKVIPLIKQYTTATEALAVANNSAGSTAADAEKAQQGLGQQVAALGERFQALFRSLSDSETFRSFAEGAIKLADAFIKLVSALEPLLPMLASMAAMKLGQIALPALGRFAGATGKNQGGRIHSFNSGGLVPGSGNRDTVPAMLSPGEFVIRKSSVNSIGAGNLAKVNGYAGGGKVKNFGVAILERVGAQESSSAMLGVNEKFTYGPLVSQLQKSDAASAVPQGTTSRKLSQMIMGNYPIQRSGPTKQLKDSFSKHLDTGIIAGMEKSAGLVGGDMGLPVKPLGGAGKKNFLASINEGAVGNLFEQVLDALAGEPFDSRDSDPQRPFDFIGGLGRLADDFPGVAGLKYVEAKSSFAKSQPAKIKPKVVNQLGLLSAQDAVNQVKSNAAKTNEVTKRSKKGAISGRKKEGEGVNFNSGGRVDTVPAMLTPGEYVINKSAAQSIGYSNLNRMNKGGVAHFNSGGSVGGNWSMATPIGYNSSGQAFQTGNARLVKSTGQVVTKMDKLGRATAKGSANVARFGKSAMSGATNMAFMGAMFAGTAVQMMGLEPVLANTITQFVTMGSMVLMVIAPLLEMVVATFANVAAKGAEMVAGTALTGAKWAEVAATIAIAAPIIALIAVIGIFAFDMMYAAEAAKQAAAEVENFTNELADSGGSGNAALDSSKIQFRLMDSMEKAFDAEVNNLGSNFMDFFSGDFDQSEAIDAFNAMAKPAEAAGRNFADSIGKTVNATSSFNNAMNDMAAAGLEGADKTSAIGDATASLLSKGAGAAEQYAKGVKELEQAQKKRDEGGFSEEALKGVENAAEAAKKNLESYVQSLTTARQQLMGAVADEAKARMAAGEDLGAIKMDPKFAENQKRASAALEAEIRQKSILNKENLTEGQIRGRVNNILAAQDQALQDANNAIREKRNADREAADAAQAMAEQAIAAARALNLVATAGLQIDAALSAFDAQLNAAAGKFQLVDHKMGDFIGTLAEGVTGAGAGALMTTANASGQGAAAQDLLGRLKTAEDMRSRLAKEQGVGGKFRGGIGGVAGTDVAKEFLKQFDLKGLDDDIRTEIINKLSDGIQEGEIEEIFEMMTGAAESQIEAFQKLAEVQQSYVASYQKGITALLAAKKKERDGVNTLISIQEKGIKRMRQATGEEQPGRIARAGQNARLGNLGVNTRDTTVLGKSLRQAKDQAQRFAKAAADASDPRIQKELGARQQFAADKAERLGEALKLLTDRSAEAAEILGEIDVERGKREAVQKAIKDFTFATNDQRQSMTTNFAALQRVLATGDINSVPDKFRAAVGQLLDQFKDVDFGGGRTGGDISKQLQVRQMEMNFRRMSGGRQGVPPQLVKAIFKATTKEEKLIAELGKLNQEEAAAQKELIAAQKQETMNVMKSIHMLVTTMNTLIGKLAQGAGAAGGAAMGGLVPVQGFANGGNVFKPRGTDTVPAMLTPGEFVVRKSAVDKIGMGALTSLNNGNASPVYRAQGGFVESGDGLLETIHTNLFTLASNHNGDLEEAIGNDNIVNKLTQLGQMGLFSKIAKVANMKAEDKGLLENTFKHSVQAMNMLSNLDENYSHWGFSHKNKTANRNYPAGSWLSLGGGRVQLPKNLTKTIEGGGQGFFKDQIWWAKFQDPALDDFTGVTQREASESIANFRRRAYGALVQTSNDGGDGRTITRSMFPTSLKAVRGNEGYLHTMFNPPFIGDWYSLIKAWHNSNKNHNFQRMSLNQDQAGMVRNQMLASGGSVDSVPAMLTPGEFVMSRSAVKKHGTGFMSSVNRGKIPGFARGGSVGGVQYRQNGGPIGGMGQNMMDAIAQSLSIFDNLAGMLNDIAVMFSNLQISHTIQVDGTLNIPGFSQQAINSIVNTIGQQVVTQTEEKINVALDEFSRKLDQRAD